MNASSQSRSGGSVLRDLSILISLVAGARHLLVERGDGGFSSALRGRRTLFSQQRNTTSLFSVGDVVEVYEPEIHELAAFVAVVSNVNTRRNGQVQYDLRAGPSGNDDVYSISEESLSSHEAYAHDTPALCEYGSSLTDDSDLSPCSIVSSLGDDASAYLVSSMRKDGVSYEEMPLNRIRRIIKTTGLNEEQFERHLASPYDHLALTSDAPEPEVLEGLVEFFWDGARFATPAMIAFHDEDNQRFSVQSLTNHARHTVDARYVRPYRAYPAGTMGSCNVGPVGEVELVSCRIESHSVESGGAVSYEVLYTNEEDEETRTRVSFARMQRMRSLERVEREL